MYLVAYKIDNVNHSVYYLDMDIKKIIRLQMVKSDIRTDAELASKCGWTRANYFNKLKRGNFKLSDLETIANAMGCDLSVEFIERKN